MTDFTTKLIHNKGSIDPATGAVSVPIYQVSTFDQNVGNSKEYVYSRAGNPTRAALEAIIAELEGGTAGFAFASGMAAISAALLVFGQGDHLLAPKDVYGGTYRMLTSGVSNWGISHTLVDTTNLEAIKAAVKSNTKGLILESPSNPLLKVSDLPAICAWAKKQGIVTIVDNTFMTPYLQNPLKFGADIVVHSATKFIAGHSDVVAGLAVTADEKLAHRLNFLQSGLGGILGPQDSWLTIRGIKTLKVRMDQAEKAALFMAKELHRFSSVKAVHYPGLPSDPGHELLKNQAKGFGAVLSFELETEELARKLLADVRLLAAAVSLGGVESILSYPAKMSHAAIPAKIRQEFGISDSLLRLSLGLEDPEDLLAEFLKVLK